MCKKLKFFYRWGHRAGFITGVGHVLSTVFGENDRHVYDTVGLCPGKTCHSRAHLSLSSIFNFYCIFNLFFLVFGFCFRGLRGFLG